MRAGAKGHLLLAMGLVWMLAPVMTNPCSLPQGARILADPAGAAAGADIVLLGRVDTSKSVREDGARGSLIVSVERVFKGASQATLEFPFRCEVCVRSPPHGELAYLFLTTRHDGLMDVNHVTALRAPADFGSRLGAAKAPAPGSQTIPAPPVPDLCLR